jgi:hypothetical protein
MPANPHVRFYERGKENGGALAMLNAAAPFLDCTKPVKSVRKA